MNNTIDEIKYVLPGSLSHELKVPDFRSNYNLVEIRYNIEQLSEVRALNVSAKEVQLA
jgi:hypothetical protein